MANQITIDIGAAANDGTGDPLRTAFNYVNDNFSNVWNTGLPNSNVQFSDNRILTVNTNANLVLTPNGIGKVVSNVGIVPNMANVHDLGSSTRRWNTIYAQYLTISNDVTFADLTVDGNLTVTGNIVDTGALTIITGSNGNIALAPNGTGIVTASGNISAVGNISGGNLTTAGLTSTASLSVTGNTATVTTANYSIGYLNVPQVSLAANATIALTDSGKHYYSVSASNLSLTIANNTSVSWPVGTAISIVNANTANILINQGTDVSLYLAGNATAGNRVLSTFGMATIMNTAANVWFINGTGLT